MNQNVQLYQYMVSNGNLLVSEHAMATGNHGWTWDETVVCNDLNPHQLQLPLHGKLLIDRDARFYAFDVQQTTGGAFSRVNFTCTQATRTLELRNTENIEQIAFDPADLGILPAPGQNLKLQLQANDFGDEVVVRNLPSAPVSVLRDGVTSTAWSYAAGELTVNEAGTATHLWTVQY
ncbi:MAG: hypothetical protein R3E96_16155 [Planctomycetota bacterium]